MMAATGDPHFCLGNVKTTHLKKFFAPSQKDNTPVMCRNNPWLPQLRLSTILWG
jgi:hypothetical protein